VSLSGEKIARRHLKLAYTPPRRGAGLRAHWILRTMAVFLRIAWVNLVAVAGAVSALVPLLGRRRPVGTRAATPRRAAHVIPFARRAQNR
jgi:hypothetical protein